MSDIKKGTQFMRGEVKWASVLTPNTTFEPTFQASIYNPIVVNNFGEVIDSDSESIVANFESRGFKHTVKTDKESNEKFLFFKYGRSRGVLNMTEEDIKPFITIDDVQINVEDLPEEGQGIFGRLQRLNQKKANLTLDLEELQAGINFFSGKIIEIVNGEGQRKADAVVDADVVEEELPESDDSD